MTSLELSGIGIPPDFNFASYLIPFGQAYGWRLLLCLVLAPEPFAVQPSALTANCGMIPTDDDRYLVKHILEDILSPTTSAVTQAADSISGQFTIGNLLPNRHCVNSFRGFAHSGRADFPATLQRLRRVSRAIRLSRLASASAPGWPLSLWLLFGVCATFTCRRFRLSVWLSGICYA